MQSQPVNWKRKDASLRYGSNSFWNVYEWSGKLHSGLGKKRYGYGRGQWKAIDNWVNTEETRRKTGERTARRELDKVL